MNNWNSRIALFAVIGAILSSVIFAGCGNSSDSASGNAAGNMANGGQPTHDTTSKP